MQLTHFRTSDTLSTSTTPLENAFWTRDDTLDGAFHTIVRFILNYLHWTLPSTALYALLDKDLVAWPHLSITSSEDDNTPRLFDVLPWPLLTTLLIPISSSFGGSLITLDCCGICATEVQETL